MEAMNGSQAAATCTVAVRLSPFWSERPAMWFAQTEGQFSLEVISNDRIKFYHTISQLDHRYAVELEDIITFPPQQIPYTTLKTELLNRLSHRREQRPRQNFTLQQMGDR
jgi:hypothetical protein